MDMSKKNPSDIDKARGLRLEKLFELNKLSNADVARSMKRKSRAVPGRWCSGESFLTDPEDIAKLARILGTTTEYILYGTGPAQANTSSYPVPQDLPIKEPDSQKNNPRRKRRGFFILKPLLM